MFASLFQPGRQLALLPVVAHLRATCHRLASTPGRGIRFGLGSLSCLLFVWAPLAADQAPGTELPRVLVLHSYHEGMEWTDGISAGLKETLNDKAELVIHYLDIKRFPPQPRQALLEASLEEVVRRTRPQLFITVDDFAYSFLLVLRDRLAPGTPIVFAGVNHWQGPAPQNVTGIVEAANLESTLTLAFQLHPEARRLVVVNDRTETGQSNRAALARVLPRFRDKTPLYLGEGSFADTEAQLCALHATHDVVLLLSWNLDADGVTRSYPEAIARARALSAAPIYSVWSFYLGRGIVGGILLDGHTHGQEAAEIALRILQGSPAHSIPVVTQPRSRLLLDERELNRFRVDPRRLPFEAEIKYRETSLWERHRTTLLAIALVVTLQAVTIAWLSVTIMRRRRAEQSLRSNEEQLRMTLDAIQDAVISADTEERIQRMNPVAEQLTGWSMVEAAGRKVSEVFSITQRGNDAQSARPTATALETGAVVRSFSQQQLLARDGSHKPISYSAAPIRDGRGHTAGVVLAFRDISHHVKLEEQVRQSQKIESLGLLAGGVAHDFNNILMAINGNLELLSDPTCPPADAAECRKEIGKATRRATALTQQLLAFGRRQKLAPRQLDLSELAEGMLKMVQRLIGVNITLHFEPEPGRYWTHADPGQIEQVILNLCLNARDAMPKGGRLELGLTHCTFTEDDTLLANWIRPGRFVQLTVADSGSGMDRETLQRIFEPFFTTKKAGQGTGLGLSVVQGIIHQHGGLINVYSAPGQGTVFRVYLPASEPEAAPASEAKAATLGPPVLNARHKGALLLLAEDDSAARLAVSSILRRAGYRVLAVADGEEACQVCRTVDEPLAAAILDVMMPRVGGPEAAARIAEQHPRLPIILCSGHPSAMELAPHWRWLQKPYSSVELLAELDRCLD